MINSEKGDQMSLTDIIESNKLLDAKKAVNYCVPVQKPSFVPHDYQRTAIDFILAHHSCACFLDCGLGKTPISLAVIKKLNEFPVLVIGPKLVVENVWIQEARKWAEFEDLTFSSVTGDTDKRMKALKTKAQIYLLSRDNLDWAVSVGLKLDRFKFIVIDESSSFKNPSAKRTQALFNLPHPRKVLLSATPAPKNLQDLYAQFKILDGGRSLGRTLTEFRSRYMYCVSKKKNFWVVRYGQEDHVYQDIKPITVSMNAADYLKLPPIMTVPHVVELSDKERAVYDRMEEKAVLNVISSTGAVEKVTAKNAAVLTAYLLQLSSGFLYDSEGKGVTLHTHKMEMLSQLCDEADVSGERLVVCYFFKADREALLKMFAERGYKVADLTTSEGVRLYKAQQCDIAILHPRSAGMGLNLQEGSRTMVWYTLPWSFEDYYQTVRRIYRQGQTKPCIIHTILAKDTADFSVVKALQAKKKCDDELKNATKAKMRKYLKAHKTEDDGGSNNA